MSFSYEVYKSQRIIPLRFRRAVGGQPVMHKPDIDDQGFYRAAVTAGNDHGFVVGITEGNESEIKVERERIDNKADLFVTSSDTATLTVTSAAGTNALPADRQIILKIKGVRGGAGANPQTAKAQIRYGSATGPIIGEISVWVFTKITVNLTPHRVTIASATTAGIASTANIGTIIDLVKSFWEPCGVSFNVDAEKTTAVTLATAGRVTVPEINTLFTTPNYVAGSINAYFVFQYRGSNDGTLGRGESRANATAHGLTNPGIILGDATVNGTDRHTDTHWLANDLAHEIGHFFTLEHVDRKHSNAPRNDTWALRRLMYPINTYNTMAKAWQNDVGYGTNYRGGLITNKNLTDSANAANHSTDGESLIARAIAAVPANLY